MPDKTAKARPEAPSAPAAAPAPEGKPAATAAQQHRNALAAAIAAAEADLNPGHWREIGWHLDGWITAHIRETEDRLRALEARIEGKK